MAYYDKYRITYATQTSKTVYLYLQEDLPSAPTIIDFIGIDISLEYIPTGDEIYEAIYASQIEVTIDVTDSIANIPDFISVNDRKYFAKLYLGADLEWTGYTLSDNVQISYSTGRKELKFNAVDGLGMLKDIPLPINNIGNRTNDLKSVLYYIQTALNALSFPTTPNLITVCSYYALDMLDRSDGLQYEPFNQSLLPIRTFKNEDYTYESCYEVLEKLVKSFGCRLFQAGGKWWIVAVNEFANENNYYTEYNNAGTVVSFGSNLNTLSQIQGYAGNASGLYFVDNSQFKLMLKGFNRVDFTQTLDYKKELVDNGNLKIFSGSPLWQPQSWTVFNTGAGASFDIVNNETDAYAQMRFIKTAGGYTTMVNNYMPKVSASDVLSFSMLFLAQGTSTRGYLSMSIFDGVNTYYLDTTGGWQSSPSSGYVIPAASTNQPNTFSFKTQPCVNSGQLTISFSNQIGTSCTITEFSVKSENELQKIDYYGYITNTQQYKKEIDLPFGYGFTSGFPTTVGAILKSDSTIWTNWYRFGKTGTFGSLNELIVRQILNCYAKNIINLDCSIGSFVTTNPTYPYVNASKMIKATDTDPAQINISSKSYMLGNCTIDYTEDTIDATLLEISNTDIPATINYINYYK